MPDETTQTPVPAPPPDAAPVVAPPAQEHPVLRAPLTAGDAVPDSPDSYPAIDVTDTAADEPAASSDAPAASAPATELTAAAAAAYVRCPTCSYKPCSVECYVKAGNDAAGFDACVARCEADHAASSADAAANGKAEPPPPETHHVIEIVHGSVRIQNAQWLRGPKQSGNAWQPGAVLRVDVETAKSLSRVAKRIE